MTSPNQRGFTLVEILIVVIILGVLAAIAIPASVDASSQAKQANLQVQLHVLRRQLQFYKAEHDGQFPDRDLVNQLTLKSNVDGDTTDAKDDPGYPFGPYLMSWPVNPVSGSGQVRFSEGGQGFVAPAEDGGWWYNTTTGDIRANLAEEASEASPAAAEEPPSAPPADPPGRGRRTPVRPQGLPARPSGVGF